MSLGSEIKSFAKWTAVIGTLNAGLVLIVFGLMAQQNACTPHLVQTFMMPGYFFTSVGSLSVGIAGFTSVVARVIKWRRLRALREERERLKTELSALDEMAQGDSGIIDRALGASHQLLGQ